MSYLHVRGWLFSEISVQAVLNSIRKTLVQRFLNPHILSACYFCQRKAEEGGNAVALLTDDNAAMAEIESTKCMRD
ncbi:hypothetical protein D7V86_19010 [bacterium D16-51]|nr:hypothetical protein D7V96_06375 [bacterium D16-59]RKI56680.1 hypothetical protein D7V86_19010 [bacterium D16-51]